MMPRFLKTNSRLDVCREPLTTRLESVSSFFDCFQKLVKNFVIGRKKNITVLAGRLFIFTLTQRSAQIVRGHTIPKFLVNSIVLGLELQARNMKRMFVYTKSFGLRNFSDILYIY